MTKDKLKVENPSEVEFPALEGKLDASGRRFAIVVARFNSFITERLLLSACDGLLRSGAARKDIEIVRVPGAFEIPLAARTLALEKPRYYLTLIFSGISKTSFRPTGKKALIRLATLLSLRHRS